MLSLGKIGEKERNLYMGREREKRIEEKRGEKRERAFIWQPKGGGK